MRRAPRAAPVGFTPTDGLLALMSLIWGVNYIVIKAALEGFQPLAFNATRFPIASVVLLLAARGWGARLPPRRYWLAIALYGVLGNAVYQIGFIEGLARTRAGNAALISAANPVLTAVLSHWRGHERLTARDWLGLVASGTGVVLVVLGSGLEVGFGPTVVGDLLLLGAVLCWAIYAVGSQPLVEALGSVNMTAWTTAAGAVPIVLMGVPSLVTQHWEAVSVPAWGAVLYASFGAIVTGYLLWARGIRVLGSTRVALYSNFTPVFAFLVAWPMLGERPTPFQLVGGVAIALGMYVTRL